MVCLGDVAATGPRPRECLARLGALGCAVVLGNADAWLLDPTRREGADEETRRFEDIDLWCAGQLGPDDREYIRTFRPTVEVALGGGETLLCFHGSPASYHDSILAATPEHELERMLGGRGALVLAGGHTHVQLLRRFGPSLLLNPGSVGLPFEIARETGELFNPPWAEYALVTWEEGRLGVEVRREPVDAAAIIDDILGSGMPHAQWLAADWRTPG